MLKLVYWCATVVYMYVVSGSLPCYCYVCMCNEFWLELGLEQTHSSIL